MSAVERYPVRLGYPSDHTASGMLPTPTIRRYLSAERFGKWAELMKTLAMVDRQMQAESVAECTRHLPPSGQMLILFDVVIRQHLDTDPAGYVWHFASLSYGSIAAMIEQLKLSAAVEDEQEAEQRSITP